MRSQSSRSPLDEDAFNQAIAAEVRALLARHRKTQADVARQLDIKPNAVSFRWQGKTPWSPAQLIVLCDWLDVDAAEVMATAKAAALQQTAALAPVVTDEERAFAAEVQAERTAQGLTQADLAKRARLRESTLERIEAGTVQADPEQMSKLCRALGISIAELAQRAETRIQDEGRGQGRSAAGE